MIKNNKLFTNMKNSYSNFSYKIIYNNVLKELIVLYNKEKYKIQKSIIIKILKYEWNNNIYRNYLYSNMNDNIIINTMNNNIRNTLTNENIKLILSSLYYISFNLDYKINEIENKNRLNDNIFNLLKNMLDYNKLDIFFDNYIDNNNLLFEYYFIQDRYNNIYQYLFENNSINVFSNYNKNQPHLQTINLENYTNKELAENIYISNNGLYNETIQIRYNNIYNNYYIYKLPSFEECLQYIST